MSGQGGPGDDEEGWTHMRRMATHALAMVIACSALLMLPATAAANEVAGGGYSSSYSGESIFTSLGAGETGQFSAIFFNDGTQPWVPGVVGLLVCAADKRTCNVPSNTSYAKGWLSQTVYATSNTTILPGSNGFFSYNFTVPASTPAGTSTTFYGDLGIIASGAVIHPEGYFQTNTTPVPVITLALTPSSVSLPVGGLQQFGVSGPPIGASVAWTVNGGCGAVNSAGLFVATAMNSATQPCSVNAAFSGSTASASITVFGQASQLACVAVPSTIVADGGASAGGTATITISLKDANGNLASNAGSPSITVSNGTPALALMTPTGPVNPTAGVVSVGVISTMTPGNVQLSATAAGLTGCSVILASSLAGAPVKTVATVSPTQLAADNTSTATLQIDTVDANGLRATSDNLTQISISQTSGANVCTVQGVPIGTNAVTAAGAGSATVIQGRVAFTIQSASTPGVCGFAISTNNSTIPGTSATLTTQIVGAANRLAVLSNDSPHPAGAGGSCNVSGVSTDRSCTRIVVGVQDANGALRTGDNSTQITVTRDFSSCTLAGGGDVSNPGTLTATNGKATFLFTSGGAYDGCKLVFTSSGLISAATTAVWTAGAADHLQCLLSPAAIAVNSGAVSLGTVSVRDLGNNVVMAGTYPVTFIRTSGSATILVSPSVQNTSGGFASFTLKPGTTTGTDVWMASVSGPMTLPNVAGATPSCTVVVQ